MGTRTFTFGLALAMVIVAAGCVREATRQEVLDIARQAQMNTVATTVYYTGSDADYDYFYLEIPLGRNDACKVPRAENTVTNRMRVTAKRETWTLLAPFAMTPSTNALAFQDGTNTVTVAPELNVR